MRRYFLFTLALITVVVWITVLTFPEPKLKLIACDVGQGDAVLVILGTTQILVDGGPNNRVLDCLSKYMPFWDREIEIVLLSHPQKDHYLGLIDVFKHYQVQTFIATPLEVSSQDYQVLKGEVGGKGISVINPNSSMVLGLGLIHLDILHPSEEYLAENIVNSNSEVAEGTSPGWERESGVLGAFTSSRDPNDFSVVTILSYKNFDALFTGDIFPEEEHSMVETGQIRDVDYIKIPHHGSKNGLTQELLDAASPEVAVISVGKNNTYGHPHEEVIKLLRDFRDLPAGRQVKILRTDQAGNIEIISDGEMWWVKE